MTDQTALDAFRAAHPDLDRVEVFVTDMNGILRGKWLPGDQLDKIIGGVRLPVSTSALDIWGHDVDGSGLGIVSGDKDGQCVPVFSTLVPVPWAARPTAQVLMTLNHSDGSPSLFDPRSLLAHVLGRYTAKGLTPVVATELEFFLIEARDHPAAEIAPPPACRDSHLYDFAPMEACRAVLEEIEAAAAAQNLPADTIIAESGLGQFEINFHHGDALTAADTATLFRRLVRGVAAKHGLEATFMAKPYGPDAGSGMHVHVSVEDESGNIFAGEDQASTTLRAAIGGVLRSMGPMQAIFAPHLNSYRRFDKEGFAPTSINWGYDHRAAAVRVPETKGKGARFEHRVAGADANPYLSIAAILAGALDGIENTVEPGPSIEEGGEEGMGTLTHDWATAIDRFAGRGHVRALLDPEFARVYTVLKRYEWRAFLERITDVERSTYLGRI